MGKSGSCSLYASIRTPSAPCLVLLALAGCASLFDSGYGKVYAVVRDQNNAPVANANVTVSQTNGSGGSFSMGQKTKADGSTTLGDVQKGTRTVTVTPPAGYAPGTEPLSKDVVVEERRTVAVDFALIHVVTVQSPVPTALAPP